MRHKIQKMYHLRVLMYVLKKAELGLDIWKKAIMVQEKENHLYKTEMVK